MSEYLTFLRLCYYDDKWPRLQEEGVAESLTGVDCRDSIVHDVFMWRAKIFRSEEEVETEPRLLLHNVYARQPP